LNAGATVEQIVPVAAAERDAGTGGLVGVAVLDEEAL